MTFDPTTNNIQWQRLTGEEKEAVKTWEHGWQYYSPYYGVWLEMDNPIWVDRVVYRAKPAREVA